jgi:chromosome segregation ATPase
MFEVKWTEILNSESIILHQDSTVKQFSRILQAIEEHKGSLVSCSQSLEGLHRKANTVNAQSSALQTNLAKQGGVIEETNSRTTRIHEQTFRIDEATQETSSSLAVINQQNDSILHGTTQILSMVTSGLITINSIREKIYRLFQMFTTFNAEMRAYAQHML